jgi:hypothetical protein
VGPTPKWNSSTSAALIQPLQVSLADRLLTNPRSLMTSTNQCKYIEHGTFWLMRIRESSIAASRGRTSAITTDTSSRPSEVTHRHFTRCSHGGPFCFGYHLGSFSTHRGQWGSISEPPSQLAISTNVNRAQ